MKRFIFPTLLAVGAGLAVISMIKWGPLAVQKQIEEVEQRLDFIELTLLRNNMFRIQPGHGDE